MIPTDEQVKEFWGKCGLVCINNSINQEVSTSCEAMTLDKPVSGWYKPDYQKGTSKLISLRDTPPIDLNNLFRYAVPKIEMPVMLSTYLSETEVVLPSYFPDAETPEEDFMSPPLSVKNEDPALALFWACYEALEAKP